MVNESLPNKDTLQAVADSAAEHLGKIATIVQTAVVDIAKELGEWFSDVMAARETPSEPKREAAES
ncbi:hypothetical protein [Actinophytocola sp.]|uniref:hypothetical protein n=1 Tax=Actinophytocola sp. TaxID=1872138 RepID=UPI002D7F42B0|nr:hypothetical protein [Actinophytocola sp.]HET9142427.1 hypothetical protein [Actinophytocola sp.]